MPGRPSRRSRTRSASCSSCSASCTSGTCTCSAASAAAPRSATRSRPSRRTPAPPSAREATVATHLTVLYDARCDFCRSVRAWLEGQPKYVPLRFAAVGSERAQALFPALEHAATLGEITVVRSDGAVYRGERAYLMVLWALRRYRGWA